ncbi:hypothetical protein GQ473_05620 [archaeon]|nr:hypothetical protein [archaeon]
MEFIGIVVAVVLGLSIFSLIGTLVKGFLLLDFDDMIKLITHSFMFVCVIGPVVLFQLININILMDFASVGELPSVFNIEGWFLLLIPLVAVPMFVLMFRVTENKNTIYD